MKPKMGRPAVKKAKKRDIFMITRVSPEENRVIIEAIKRGKEAKSVWIRKALLSTAVSDKPAS
ncbi:MAG: hypothetical protein WBN22_10205 [Verrucomicrobiia bacterium]